MSETGLSVHRCADMQMSHRPLLHSLLLPLPTILPFAPTYSLSSSPLPVVLLLCSHSHHSPFSLAPAEGQVPFLIDLWRFHVTFFLFQREMRMQRLEVGGGSGLERWMDPLYATADIVRLQHKRSIM